MAPLSHTYEMNENGFETGRRGRRPLQHRLRIKRAEMGQNERMFVLSSRNSKICIDKIVILWYNTHISSEQATARLK